MNALAQAQPLQWGEGKRLFEMFVEPTCPYSVVALGKLMPLLDLMGPERVQIRIWLHSQPWHMYSPVVVRAILAASTLEDGRQSGWQVMQAVAKHRDDYEFHQHAGGLISM